VRDSAELSGKLLELVNQVRAQASLPAVTLSTSQSATATKLAPPYFEAFSTPAKQQEAEVIVLGLLAGWDVAGEAIHSADFTSAIAGPTRDARQWLSWGVVHPP